MVSKYHYYRLSVFVCSLHLQPPHFNFFTYLRVWSWLLKFNLPSSSSFYGDIIGSTAGSPTGSWPPDGVGRKPLFEDSCRHLKYRRNVSVDIYLYHVNKCLSEKKKWRTAVLLYDKVRELMSTIKCSARGFNTAAFHSSIYYHFQA